MNNYSQQSENAAKMQDQWEEKYLKLSKLLVGTKSKMIRIHDEVELHLDSDDLKDADIRNLVRRLFPTYNLEAYEMPDVKTCKLCKSSFEKTLENHYCKGLV